MQQKAVDTVGVGIGGKNGSPLQSFCICANLGLGYFTALSNTYHDRTSVTWHCWRFRQLSLSCPHTWLSYSPLCITTWNTDSRCKLAPLHSTLPPSGWLTEPKNTSALMSFTTIHIRPCPPRPLTRRSSVITWRSRHKEPHNVWEL